MTTKLNKEESLDEDEPELTTKELQQKEKEEIQKELEENYEEEFDVKNMNDDELAEILAISRKMLRKKTRR